MMRISRFLLCFLLASALLLPSQSLLAEQEIPVQSRIIGGVSAPGGAWPWAAAVVAAGQNARSGQFCGGSLISPTWVLTAAHCVRGSSPASIEVVLGRNDLRESGGERIGVKQIIPHPNFNRSNFDSDLALLELVTASSQTAISLVNSQVASDVVPGSFATTVGWGSTNFGIGGAFGLPEDLQQVDLPIVANASCSVAYGGDITANMLCAGFSQGGKDACAGDSGGPLMFSQNNTWFQIGITSFGQGCALANFPGVYTRIERFLDWIQATSGVGPGVSSGGGAVAGEQLEPTTCVLPNGFLNQINIASIVNKQTTDSLLFSIEYRDAGNVRRGFLPEVKLEPQQKLDIIINDFGLEADSVGTFCVSANTTENGKWTGGLAVYKPRLGPAGAITRFDGSDEFDYVLYYPFSNPKKAQTTFPINTSTVGTDGLGTVANWIRFADANPGNGKIVTGTLNYYSLSGALQAVEKVSIADGGRADFPGHARIGEQSVGSVQFIPDSGSDERYEEVTRYFYEGRGASSANFYTAVAIPSDSPSTAEQVAFVEASSERFSVVELVNRTSANANADVRIRESSGSQTDLEFLTLVPQGSFHRVIQSSELPSGTPGTANISGTSGAISATALTYFFDSSGMLSYAAAGSILQSAGSIQLTDFNTFIGQANRLQVYNATDNTMSTTISVVDFQENSLLSFSIFLSPRQSQQLDLVLPSGGNATYGTISANSGSLTGIVLQNVVERSEQYRLLLPAR